MIERNLEDAVHARENAVWIDADELTALRARAQELLESNTRLLEERRAVDIHYNVEQFHCAAGLPQPEVPTVPADDVVRYRMRLIAEEFMELLEATFSTSIMTDDDSTNAFDRLQFTLERIINRARIRVDLPAWADATTDLDYVVEGARQVFGVDGRPLLREVQRANMAKFGPGSGWREDGKVLKPPGWTPPDIAGELRKQGWQP